MKWEKLFNEVFIQISYQMVNKEHGNGENTSFYYNRVRKIQKTEELFAKHFE